MENDAVPNKIWKNYEMVAGEEKLEINKGVSLSCDHFQ